MPVGSVGALDVEVDEVDYSVVDESIHEVAEDSAHKEA